MTRPQNKKNIISLFQFFFLILTFVIQYYSRKKMGVQRTIAYYNYILEETYNIKIILLAIEILFFIYIIYKWFKYKKISFIVITSSLLILILMLANLSKFKLTKYSISILLLLVNILEFFKQGEHLWKDQTNY